MNNFAKILRIEGFTGNRVKYYSVWVEGRESNEFKDFISRHIGLSETEEQLNYLIRVLEKFSNEGARKHYFREERAFHALPPKARYLEFDLGREQIRLYCLHVSDNIVFLFNGGIKTKDKAQDCKNVKTFFKEAEKFTQIIDDMIKDKQIVLNKNFTEILNYEEIELWLT